MRCCVFENRFEVGRHGGQDFARHVSPEHRVPRVPWTCRGLRPGCNRTSTLSQLLCALVSHALSASAVIGTQTSIDASASRPVNPGWATPTTVYGVSFVYGSSFQTAQEGLD